MGKNDNKSVGSDKLNGIAEFKDAKKELIFISDYYSNQKNVSSIIYLILGALFLALIVFDVTVTNNTSTIVPNILVRALVFLLCIAGFFLVQREKKESRIALYNILIMAISVIGFQAVMFIKNDHDFSGIFLSYSLILIGISLLPARWIYTLIANVVAVVLFALLMPLYYDGLANELPKYIEGIIYTALAGGIGSCMAHVLHVQKRKQFIKELELEESSVVDSLTRVFNRYKFDSVLDSQIKKSILGGDSTFSLIMYDIDNFKSFNDKYGHIVGDKILISISKIVSDNIRKTDFFARWGGEEFVILLPNTSLHDSMIIAEKLRILIATNDVSVDLRLTVSLGVATFEENDTADTIIRKVDSALYKAKKEGKNRVEICE